MTLILDFEYIGFFILMCMLIASFVFFLFTKRDCKKVIYFVAFGMILGFCLLFKEQIKYASIKSPYGGIEVEIQRANTGAGRVEAIKKEIGSKGKTVWKIRE